MMPKIRIHA